MAFAVAASTAIPLIPPGIGVRATIFIRTIRVVLRVTSLEPLVHGGRTSALVAWVLTGVVALVAAERLLTNALLWGGFALFAVIVVVMPAVATGDWTTMVPWPILLVLALAVIGGAFGRYGETAGFFAVATLALVVVVELDAFTPVEMSRRFAVAFAVLTTLALQGIWTIAQFYSDRWLGTEFLRSQRELQWDIVVVTAVGLVMGAVALTYLARFDHVGSSDRSPRSSRRS